MSNDWPYQKRLAFDAVRDQIVYLMRRSDLIDDERVYVARALHEIGQAYRGQPVASLPSTVSAKHE